MIGDYTNTSAYLVAKATKTLYNAVPASSPISSSAISTPPTVPYRCQVTVTSVTGHTDCSGTVVIGSDVLGFSTSAQKKVTTTTIAANTKPAISYSSLDCNILIECLDVGGQPIQGETLTAINIRLEPRQSSVPQANGTFIKVTDTAIYSETALVVGDIIRVNSTDYSIKQADPEYDLGGEISHYSCLA